MSKQDSELKKNYSNISSEDESIKFAEAPKDPNPFKQIRRNVHRWKRKVKWGKKGLWSAYSKKD